MASSSSRVSSNILISVGTGVTSGFFFSVLSVKLIAVGANCCPLVMLTSS